MMTALRGKGGKLVDIGSGDGRIVLGEGERWEAILFRGCTKGVQISRGRAQQGPGSLQ